MRKSVKVFSIFFFFCFLFVVCLPFAFAHYNQNNYTFYSNLPEPQPTKNIKYFLISSADYERAFLYVFSLPMKYKEILQTFTEFLEIT